MNGWKGILVCSAFLCLGIALGFALAFARPGLLRRLAKGFGLPDTNQRWMYGQMLAFHRRVDACVPDGAVLFIGDSFIEGLCVTEIADHGINYGIGGDTTEGVLARLPAYGSLAHAGAVVFAVGDNDLRRGRTEDEVVANYRKMFAQVPKNVPVFFYSLTPCIGDAEHAEINRGITGLNRALKELCAAEPGRHFVDVGPALSDDRGGLRTEFADSDGMHLNGKGYRVCIEKMRDALAQTVAGPLK
ncbi:MAG TPA: GDSL-type esterase/lipase family protein [Candidatus Angelobacter sp.]|nr:GDSL-type esterase/lipase family protein [Candidatus Angelobacter sp.]